MTERARRRLYAAVLTFVAFALSLVPSGPARADVNVLSAAQLKCQGDSFRVDLLDAMGAIPKDTPDNQREQVRDWVWTATLGRLAQKTSVNDVFTSVADQPVMRDDALAHVLRQPSGPTRAATTKKGEVIVLVEVAGADVMTARVLESIDEEALYLGHTPERVAVYGYQLKASVARAEVCQIASYDRAKLEAEVLGYRKATVTKAADLEQFLAGGVDLLSAQCTASGLEVAGRQRPRNARAGMTVEHVAALAQPLGARFIPPEHFGVTMATLPPSERAALTALTREIDALESKSKLAPLVWADKEAERIFAKMVAWRRQNPKASMPEVMLSVRLQEQFDGKPGFSLDPTYSAAASIESLDKLVSALPDAVKTEGLLRAWGDDWAAKNFNEVRAEKGALEQAQRKLREVRVSLQRTPDRSVKAVLASVHPVSLGDAIASELLQSVDIHSGQQCARYDGPLAGTKAGMTFFYTDLVAKFWARGWKGVSPEGEVDGFESVVHHVSSTSECGGNERPSTRIWFGVRNEGYTRERSGMVRFAPTSTRLFAKGSNPGSGEAEAEPNAEYRRFIQWWDRHYARLAEWEPQYEALNQLMKWSAVVQSSRAAGSQSCLRFLESVPIERGHRLDRWVVGTQGLRWRGPVELAREPLKATECLPLIVSKPYRACGVEGRIAGGVGATSLKEVQARPLRSVETPIGLGRFGVETKPSVARADHVRFGRVRRNGGELRDVELKAQRTRVDFQAKLGIDVSQRGTTASWSPRSPVRKAGLTIKQEGNRLEVKQHSNDLAHAGLRLSDLDRADLSVMVDSGHVQRAKATAGAALERMQTDGVTLPEAVRRLGGEAAVLPDGRVAVRLQSEGEKKPVTVVMGSGGGIRGPPPPPKNRAGFVLGTPEDGPSHTGRRPSARRDVVHVWLLTDADMKAYRAGLAAEPLKERVSVLRATKEKVLKGDIDGAWQEVQGVNLQGATAGDFADLARAAERQRVIVVRAGGDVTKLDQLIFTANSQEAKLLVPGKDERDKIQALVSRQADTYLPAGFSPENGLPPVAHPPGKPLKPQEQYVLRVAFLPTDVEAPPKVGFGKEALELRKGQASGAESEPTRSPYRLGRSVRPALIVTRCSDTDDAKPPCHERSSFDADALLDALEGALEEAGDVQLEELRACDRDGDRKLSTPAERKCLNELRKKKSGKPRVEAGRGDKGVKL